MIWRSSRRNALVYGRRRGCRVALGPRDPPGVLAGLTTASAVRLAGAQKKIEGFGAPGSPHLTSRPRPVVSVAGGGVGPPRRARRPPGPSRLSNSSPQLSPPSPNWLSRPPPAPTQLPARILLPGPRRSSAVPPDPRINHPPPRPSSPAAGPWNVPRAKSGKKPGRRRHTANHRGSVGTP